jgi:excisionase family DNA binding protein
VATVYILIRDGRLKKVKVRGGTRIRKRELDLLIAAGSRRR